MKTIVLLLTILLASVTTSFSAEGDIYCFWDEKHLLGHDCVVERYDGIAYGPGIRLTGTEEDRNKQGAFLSVITEPQVDNDLEKYGEPIWKKDGNKLSMRFPVEKKTQHEIYTDRRLALDPNIYQLMKWFVNEGILHIDNAPKNTRRAYEAWEYFK
jgi:hypothetical protein